MFGLLQWLGLIGSVIWIIVLRMVKYYGFYLNVVIDKSLKSSSDYAIKVD